MCALSSMENWIAWVVGSGMDVILGANSWIGCDGIFSLCEYLIVHLNSGGYIYLEDIVGEGCDRYGTQNWLSTQDFKLNGVATFEWESYISQLKMVKIVLQEGVEDHLDWSWNGSIGSISAKLA